MTYAELKAALLAQIGRAPAEMCYQMVTADINRSLRIREMEDTVSLVEAAEVSLPADFMAVLAVYRDTDPRVALRPTSLQALHQGHETSGTPREYAVGDGFLLLNPAPSGAETLEIRYYARLDDLSADGDTNAILDAYPSIYIYGALAHHATLTRDIEAAAVWKAAYEEAKRMTQVADRTDRFAGAPLRPFVATAP
jgi:hypothetical protein